MKNNENENGRRTARRGRKAFLVLGIVALVLIAAVVGYAIWERPPAIDKTPAATAAPAPTAAPSRQPDDPSQPVSTPEVIDPADEIEAEALVTDREPGTYTLLVVGRDFASNSTDTIIVARMDTKAHTVDCVSIPRDTLINIPWAGTPKKINAVYPGWVNSGKSGIEGLKTYLRGLLGFDVDCYSVVNIQAMEQAVDCIGGVWFDVPQDMHYWDVAQDLSIYINKGYQLLSGADAVKVCRFRDGYAGGDIERIGVQQAFLKALAKQMLSLGNIPNLGTLVNILSENVETDLTSANIAWFARQFLQCKMEDIHFHTMPFASACLINDVSYVSVDQNAWLELINSALNPYKEPVTTANVNLLMSNYSGSNMWSTTGAIAGGADSFYCLSCTQKNGGQMVYHLPGAHLSFEEEPAEPTASPEPGEPAEPAEPSEPAEPGEPAAPDEPTEPGGQTEPGDPAEPAAPAEPSEQTEPAAPDPQPETPAE